MTINEFFKMSLVRFSKIVIGEPRICYAHHFDSVSEIPENLMNKKIVKFDIGFRCDPNSVFVRGSLEPFEFSSPFADFMIYIEI